MSPNKFLLSLLLTIVGVYFYFGSSPSKSVVRDEKNRKQDLSEVRKVDSVAVASKFAAAIETTPEIITSVSMLLAEEIDCEQALNKILSDQNASFDFTQDMIQKNALMQKKYEALPLVMSKYLNLNKHDDDLQKQKLLELAVELCNNEFNPSCSEFLYKEAFSRELTSDQQLLSFKGYLNTKNHTKEDKLKTLSTFQLNHPEPELKSELQNIQEYIENNEQFITEGSEQSNQDRVPASNLDR